MIIIESHIKGLIFDCDGTLANTMPLHYLAWEETMQAHQAHFPETLFYELAGVPSDKIVMRLNELFGYQLDPKGIAEQKEMTFFKKYLPQTQPIEPVVAIARRYKGQLPLAVATGGIANIALGVLEAIGLGDFFETVVTADDVIHGKPAPDIFLEAARRIGVAPAYCQVFEDSDLGLAGALKAGMVATDIRPWHPLS
jgi:beta-phosphoglucomutase-like phosphatase (HAD superfamily)